MIQNTASGIDSESGLGSRHGPKLGCQEAEALILEAEAEVLTLLNLEAEAKALVMKPKPGYL